MNNVDDNIQNNLPIPAMNQGKKYSSLLLIVILIVIVTIGAGGVYLWQQINRVIYRHQSDLTDLQAKVSQLHTQLAAAEETINSHTQKLGDNETHLNVLQDATLKAMELSSRQQRGWIVAEIEYLLRLANRRLEISRDIPGAIAALKGADQRLHDLADISFISLRKQLAKDIAALKSIPEPDVDGIALTLDEMISHLNQLPFKPVSDEIKEQLPDTAEITQPASEQNGFIGSILDTLMSVGDIKIHKHGIKPATPFEQQNQIEERLLGHLAGARLSALRQDKTQFERDITQALQLVSRYYDSKDNRVIQMINDLKGYQTIDLLPVLPDITASWRMLNNSNNGGAK